MRQHLPDGAWWVDATALRPAETAARLVSLAGRGAVLLLGDDASVG